MSPAIYVLIFIQVATGAPPTSRREVCHNVYGLDSLHQCPDQGPSEAGEDTMHSTPLSHTLLMAALLVAGLVTLALLAWALYSCLSQVSIIYIFAGTIMIYYLTGLLPVGRALLQASETRIPGALTPWHMASGN